MSDVAIAPAPAPAPAPQAAPQGEVAVDTNPVNTPQPIGSQIPDQPEQKKPVSRREAIQRAYDRADTAERREATKPRQAKMGDNNPPEDMDREKQTFSLKKRPSEQDEQPDTKPPRPRGEHGHFASHEQDQTGRNSQQPGQPAQQRQLRQVQPLPHQAPFREAPGRMHEQARVEWHETPESVRGEVHRMAHEFGQAFQRYRGDHEEMNRIRMFADLARKQGTTLQKALTNYVNMETKLRNDPLGGFDLITNNLNLRTPEGQQITFRDLAWAYLNQTPEQQAMLQSQNTQMAQSHQLRQVNERIAQLENQNKQLQYERQFFATRNALDKYAEARPRLDELGDIIEQEINLGFPLDVAYRRAELLRPSTQPAQTRTQAAQTRTHTAQTRTPDRSISGAPGPTNGTRPREKVSRRDALTNAMKHVNGRL